VSAFLGYGLGDAVAKFYQIICFKCKRPVEALEVQYDPVRCTTVFTAHCHGEVDWCVVDDEVVCLADRIEPGIAFSPKKQIETEVRH